MQRALLLVLSWGNFVGCQCDSLLNLLNLSWPSSLQIAEWPLSWQITASLPVPLAADSFSRPISLHARFQELVQVWMSTHSLLLNRILEDSSSLPMWFWTLLELQQLLNMHLFHWGLLHLAAVAFRMLINVLTYLLSRNRNCFYWVLTWGNGHRIGLTDWCWKRL